MQIRRCFGQFEWCLIVIYIASRTTIQKINIRLHSTWDMDYDIELLVAAVLRGLNLKTCLEYQNNIAVLGGTFEEHIVEVKSEKGIPVSKEVKCLGHM